MIRIRVLITCRIKVKRWWWCNLERKVKIWSIKVHLYLNQPCSMAWCPHKSCQSIRCQLVILRKSSHLNILWLLLCNKLVWFSIVSNQKTLLSISSQSKDFIIHTKIQQIAVKDLVGKLKILNLPWNQKMSFLNWWKICTFQSMETSISKDKLSRQEKAKWLILLSFMLNSLPFLRYQDNHS